MLEGKSISPESRIGFIVTVNSGTVGSKSMFKDYLSVTSLLCMCLVFSSPAWGVPSIENRAVLHGKVLEYSITSSSLLNIKPEQTLYKLVIAVESTETIKAYPDFLRSRVGTSVTMYSRQKLSPELFGKQIKAIAEYRGDERGGLFWIRTIEETVK